MLTDLRDATAAIFQRVFRVRRSSIGVGILEVVAGDFPLPPREPFVSRGQLVGGQDVSTFFFPGLPRL